MFHVTGATVGHLKHWEDLATSPRNSERNEGPSWVSLGGSRVDQKWFHEFHDKFAAHVDANHEFSDSVKKILGTSGDSFQFAEYLAINVRVSVNDMFKIRRSVYVAAFITFCFLLFGIVKFHIAYADAELCFAIMNLSVLVFMSVCIAIGDHWLTAWCSYVPEWFVMFAFQYSAFLGCYGVVRMAFSPFCWDLYFTTTVWVTALFFVYYALFVWVFCDLVPVRYFT